MLEKDLFRIQNQCLPYIILKVHERVDNNIGLFPDNVDNILASSSNCKAYNVPT
ncbi:MAG: hypothetical protein QXP32_03590 [Nitrososphaeria archaeon]